MPTLVLYIPPTSAGAQPRLLPPGHDFRAHFVALWSCAWRVRARARALTFVARVAALTPGLYAAAQGKAVDDPDLQDFFKLKLWV